MSSQQGALLTTGGSAVVGMREDLGDTVNRMDPGITPGVSWFGSATADNTTAHEWLTIDLRAPQRSPAPEGDTRVNGTPKRSTRLGNTCEIFFDQYGVSGSTQAANVAGSMGKLVEQRMLKGLELRRDLEVAVLGTQAKSTTDPREMAGVQTYSLHYNVGAGGTVPLGTGAQAVAYDPTSQALDLDLIDTVMQGGWQYGARYSLFIMSSAQKRSFDLVIPVENLTDNQIDIKNDEGATIVTTVAVWKSTFGQVKFVMDPVLDQYPAAWAERCILGFDERDEYRPKVCTLPGRDWQAVPMAKVGDTDQEFIVAEKTLEVPNPRSVMVIGALAETYGS